MRNQVLAQGIYSKWSQIKDTLLFDGKSLELLFLILMECMRHCQYQLQYLKVQNNFTEVLICLFSESPRLFDNFWDDKNTLLALQQCFKINQHVIRDYNPTHNIQICHFNCQSQKEICFILKRCTIFSTGIGHWSYGFSYRHHKD